MADMVSGSRFPTLHSGSPNLRINRFTALYIYIYVPVAPANVYERAFPLQRMLFPSCLHSFCVNCVISRLSYRVGEVRR